MRLGIFSTALAVAFALIATPFIIIGLIQAYNNVRLDQHGVMTEGYIKTDDPSEDEVYLIYEYFVDAKQYSDAQTISRGSKNYQLYEREHQLQVTYLPNRPSINRLETRDPNRSIVLIGVGGIAGSLTLGALGRWSFRRSRQRKPDDGNSSGLQVD